MARTIISCSNGVDHVDFRACDYRLESERGATCEVEVRVTGTALACRDDTLPAAVVAAKASRGRSVLEGLLSWARPPRLIVVTSDWITLFHPNGHWSRVGRRPSEEPARWLGEPAERSRSHAPLDQGVRREYVYRDEGRWVLRSIQAGALRHEEPSSLADIVARLSGEQLQAALDLDPEGASELAATSLDEAERRILHGLIEEWIDDTVDDLRIRLTRGRELTYGEVQQALERLGIRGYVEEFRPGHWRATDTARYIRRRLLGTESLAA